MVLRSILSVFASTFLIFPSFLLKKKSGYFLATEPKKAETARKLFSQFFFLPTEFGGLKSLCVSGLEKWQYDSDEGHCQGLDLRLAS